MICTAEHSLHYNIMFNTTHKSTVNFQYYIVTQLSCGTMIIFAMVLYISDSFLETSLSIHHIYFFSTGLLCVSVEAYLIMLTQLCLMNFIRLVFPA